MNTFLIKKNKSHIPKVHKLKKKRSRFLQNMPKIEKMAGDNK